MTLKTTSLSPARVSWNRGRLVGPKPPLKPKHIWTLKCTRFFGGS